MSALLPLGAEDDLADDAEAALLAHERLDEARAETVPLLREVLARALAAGATDAALVRAYDDAAELRRLEGVLPTGVFGRSTRLRHLALLAAWRDGVAGDLGTGSPVALAPIWLGGGPEHRRGLDIRPAIPLEIALPDGTATVELGGVTEPLASIGGRPVAISFIASPKISYLERDYLRAWLTHLGLSAAGIAGGDLDALLVRPDEAGGAQVAQRTFPAVTPADARSHLAALAGELLGGVHDYLLPCEGIFTWRRRLGKPQALGIRDAVLLVRDDNWTHLSSDRGPVTDARRYPVPAEEEAAALVARRFGAYFEATPPQAKAGRR